MWKELARSFVLFYFFSAKKFVDMRVANDKAALCQRLAVIQCEKFETLSSLDSLEASMNRKGVDSAEGTEYRRALDRSIELEDDYFGKC